MSGPAGGEVDGEAARAARRRSRRLSGAVAAFGGLLALAGLIVADRVQSTAARDARVTAEAAARDAAVLKGELAAARGRLRSMEERVETLTQLSASLGRGVESARAETRRLAEILESLPPPATAGADATPAAGDDAPLTAEEEADLADRFDDLNPGVRLSVVVGLRRGSGDRARDVARRALDDVRPDIRREGARLCALLSVDAAVPALVDRLSDGSPLVREAAIDALRTLEGTDLEFDPVAPEADREKAVAAWKARLSER